MGEQGASRAAPDRRDDAPDDRARLLTRVRAALAARSIELPQQEKAMFGVRALMLGDQMLVAAHRDGSLLVRVRPAEHELLVARPGAAQAQMGTGRSMGAGWITVDAEALATDADLGAWVDAALDRHRDASD